ncbi:hypothetical protein RO3G_14523 [Rhizopus delemar RA 99-880]|uniref:Major facilitator superfamily (MFS) profile domain-containing protein n=1 Tax=Rhizopus delemar (strain RA 99-880 / ATCC MYA-4621 / FGSC 9543 / NRRL 43880) TaxID=246409 RepID=I1CMY2_RHIO9|nr:hypothetical protein RO3G_14523 [Rhizopus delemar RA 99-880]|eukprot:EIE89812.1 hypothetical protein RO3G_14523 [Rhizopus delemar RA 99-880]
MPYGGNNLKSSSDISLESNVTKDDGSLEKTVTGSFLVQITSFGVISSCDPKSLVNLSFVGTLALIFSYGLSPIVQVCTSIYGVRPIMMVGTLLIVISMEMAGFATQVWHLYLTQGVLFGIGASCMYVTVMAVTPQWFTRRRGIALGIVAGGSGIGGLVIPLIYTAINQRLGSGWTYRIMGFICLACDVVACVFVKEREQKRERKKLRDIVQLDVLKNFNFLLFSVGSDIALLGYFVPLFFVPSYATYLGLSDSQGSSLVSVASAMNFVGRLAAGLLGDRIGQLNSNIIFTVISAFSSFLIWTFAYSFNTLMGFMVVYGFFCGSYFALMSNISANLLGMAKFPSGLSFLLLINIVSVFGPNISSAIETGVSSEPYFSYKMFTGVAYLLGSLILIVLKLRLDRNPLAKV